MSNTKWDKLSAEEKIRYIHDTCTDFFLMINKTDTSIAHHARLANLRSRINSIRAHETLTEEEKVLGFSARGWAQYPAEWKAARLLEVAESYFAWQTLLSQYDQLKPTPLVSPRQICAQIERYLESFELLQCGSFGK
jgi:hypothetical protein